MITLPSGLDWNGVMSATGDLLGNGMVVAGVLVSIALAFGPRIMRAVRKSISTR